MVGPGPAQSSCSGVGFTASVDEDIRVELARAECDEDVLGLGRGGGYDRRGSFDAGLQERLVGGGRGGHEGEPSLGKLFVEALVWIDDHHLAFGSLQLVDHCLTEATEAGHDDVVLFPLDPAHHELLSDGVFDSALDHQLGEQSQAIEGRSDSHSNEQDREDAPGR